MPRFYFDIWDNNGPIRDEEGLDLADVDAAQKEAALSLLDMIKEMRPTTESHSLEVEVLDDKRSSILKATIHFDVTRVDQ
jgi:hypothetical protein